MNNSDKYLEQILQAFDFAVRTGSFDKRNIVDNAENVCVFGLGTYFHETFIQQDIKERFHVNLLCDNNPDKWNREFHGVRCIPPNELKNFNNVVVIIMIGDPRNVQKQLDGMGIVHITISDLMLDSINDLPRNKDYFLKQKEKIIRAYSFLEEEESKRIYVNLVCNRIASAFSKFSYEDLFSKDEYFGLDILPINSHEFFVDCGAFNGDTILRFLSSVGNEFEFIYAFELDKDNYISLETCINDLRNNITNKIECINAGAWDEDKEMEYGKSSDHDNNEAVSLFKKGNCSIAKVVRLDNQLEGKRITFIKMDIEGAEQFALKGSKYILINQKPKLAICIYHRWDDLWEIPTYIKDLVPEYKIKIRHHFFYNVWGTVCYAYVDDEG